MVDYETVFIDCIATDVIYILAGQIYLLHSRLPSIPMAKCGSHTLFKALYKQVIVYRASKMGTHEMCGRDVTI